MKWSVLLTFCLLCMLSTASASVQVTVCDPVTLQPYPPTDIMVGMDVALVVSSDSNDLWSGGLFIEGNDRALGTLSARGKDPNSRDWTKSHLSAAGMDAQVLQWKDSIRWGFDFYTDVTQRWTGTSFVLDYRPIQPGECTVAFYDHGLSWTVADPNESILFINTPSRDFVPDGIVNYRDFAVFSSHWLDVTGIHDPNLLSPADLSMDGQVDLLDLCMFTDFWMYGVPGWKPQPPSGDTPPPQIEPEAEPLVAYGISDANMLSEITLTVGQSVTLYIDKSADLEGTQFIDLEVLISDPNLGSIDNTPIDPNNPPGPGTARLLASPRTPFFDYWGPGQSQWQGIEFIAASFSGPILDGTIASFVYTADREGTVLLELADYGSLSDRQAILIHQVKAPAQMMMTAPNTAQTLSATDESSETVASESTADPNQLADFLDDIWQNDAQVRQEIDEPTWNEFVDSVRDSAEE